MASKPLRGQVACVTGASQGIGLAVARALATEGCHLVITGRNLSTLNKAAKELAKQRVRVLPIACDVRDEGQVSVLFAAVRKRFRRLDVLVNNAGVAHSNLPVARMSLSEWNQVLETNLTGTFLVTRAALPLLRRGGSIVNNLSVSAKRTFPGMAAYTAAKHGGLGFTKTLREELRPQGIRVIALLPGATDTAIWDAFWPGAPRKKMMSAETVAQAVVNALKLSQDSTVEELLIAPTGGAL